MFCPLCYSEYRPEISHCNSCDTDLFISLDDPSALGNPRRLIWIAKDREEFDLVVSAFRESQVPAFAEEGGTGLLGPLLRPYSKIYVHDSDIRRALTIASASIAKRRIGSSAMQTCPSCSETCSAGLSFCPWCANMLKAQEPETARELKSDAETRSAIPGKVCPDCGATFPENYERCTMCGVELVPEGLFGEPRSESERRDRLVVAWRAGNPAMVSEAVALLRQAGIRHFLQPTNQHLSFELAVPRPLYQIFVLESDINRARECVEAVRDTAPFASDPGPEIATVLPQVPSVKVNGEPASTSISELWSGEDSSFADFLVTCLRENRITPLRADIHAGMVRVSVRHADFSAGREILRELLESTPLE